MCMLCHPGLPEQACSQLVSLHTHRLQLQDAGEQTAWDHRPLPAMSAIISCRPLEFFLQWSYSPCFITHWQSLHAHVATPLQVWLLLGLVREVTNVQLTPFFHRPGEPDRRGWSWERVGGFGHGVRRWLNRCADGIADDLSISAVGCPLKSLQRCYRQSSSSYLCTRVPELLVLQADLAACDWVAAGGGIVGVWAGAVLSGASRPCRVSRAKAFLFATKTGYSASEALAFLKRHSRKASYNG